MSDADIRDLINRVLQQMGFRNHIMRTRNINQEKYDEMLTEIIKEGALGEYANKYAGTSREALEAIREKEKKLKGHHLDAKDVFKVLEELCNLDDAIKTRASGCRQGACAAMKATGFFSIRPAH